MASIQANATASLSANGRTTATGSIAWTAPSLPEGVTSWDSVEISGMWTWNGKGSITRVTINGTNTTAGVAFSIPLSTSQTSPLSITCVGNKNATGSNFAWSNLIVTYTYTEPSTGAKMHIIVSGIWTPIQTVYKKINGVWVEQTSLEGLLTTDMNLVQR